MRKKLDPPCSLVIPKRRVANMNVKSNDRQLNHRDVS